jgi:hypothetical protein
VRVPKVYWRAVAQPNTNLTAPPTAKANADSLAAASAAEHLRFAVSDLMASGVSILAVAVRLLVPVVVQVSQ